MNPTPRRDPYRLIGELFAGRYRLDEFAGAGSFGAVYRATDTRLGRTVAVKILKPDIREADAADARLLFQREALTAGRLNHPNIVAVTDAGEESDFAFMVMEWLEGRTLEDEMRARGPLAPEEVAALLAPICDALDSAHEAGVIHRDIKPSNIHLGRQGRAHVKVLDFGIAKVVTSASAAAASRIAGTLTYMSPEQLGGDAIDRRADIYSLGVMLYQMLSGTLPFNAETQGQIIHHHIVTPPPPLRNVRPDIAPRLSPIAQRAMAKRREERYQSATQLYDEFVAALGLSPAQQSAQFFLLSAPAPAPPPRSDAPATLAAQQALPTQPLDEMPRPTMQAPPPPDFAPLTPAANKAPIATQEPRPFLNNAPPQSPARAAAGLPAATSGSAFISAPPAALSNIPQRRLRPVRNCAIIGAVVVFLLSIGIGLLARYMEFSRGPESYDDFALELVLLALRDGIFGALVGATLSEFLPRAPRWSIAPAWWLRSLIVHASLGAAALMAPFVLLRTGLFKYPFAFALAGAVIGMLVCAIRLAAQRFAPR